MNPLLPRNFFTPDAEARVMPDGRLYLYGSNDISGSKEYCSKEYRVFSTEDPKLEEWRDHGISFRNTVEEPGIQAHPDTLLFAPDAIYCDGKYYLYICGSNEFEWVAEADKPEGPFEKARPVVGADGTGIDPAVFIDDDGQAYYFWGQFRLKGAKLNKDMTTLDMSSLNEEVLTEMEHGFHEGASIRKRGSKYYMVYTDVSRGKATCMSYAMADSPLGPYQRGGVIVDNVYCDPSSWNNHGSIGEFNGQWYVFYHRSTQNGVTCRRVCAEPIFFNEDGTIDEVPMTSQGAGDPVDAFAEIDAAIACRMKGNIYIVPYGEEDNEILTNCGGGNWIEDWAEYRYIDFAGGASAWKLTAKGEGSVSVMADSRKIGSITVNSEELAEFSGVLTATVEGIKPVWLLFEGKGMDVDSFIFFR